MKLEGGDDKDENPENQMVLHQHQDIPSSPTTTSEKICNAVLSAQQIARS